MTTEQKNIECAKRDGVYPTRKWRFKYANIESYDCYDHLDYHSSRDAIIPLIERQPNEIRRMVVDALLHGNSRIRAQDCVELIISKPQQLQDALLRAWGIEI